MHTIDEGTNDAGHYRHVILDKTEIYRPGPVHDGPCFSIAHVTWTGQVENGRVVDERVGLLTTREEWIDHNPDAEHTPGWLAALTPEWTTFNIPADRRAAG